MAFATSLRLFGVWTIPCPYCYKPQQVCLCLQLRAFPSSLYTFRKIAAWLGIGKLLNSVAFTDFEKFYLPLSIGCYALRLPAIFLQVLRN